MTHGSGSPARIVACTIALVALAGASPVRAQPQDEPFKSGLDARKNERWAETAAQMRRAIDAERNESQRKVGQVLGFGGTEYLPHFFLGEAQFNLGNCAAAEDAWLESQRQGVVSKVGNYAAQIRKGYADCEARGYLLREQFERTRREARQQVDDVTRLVTSVRDLGQAQIDVWQDHPTMKEQYERAAADIKTATSRLGEATRTRLAGDFTAVTDATGRARGTLVALEAELKSAIARVSRVRSFSEEVKRLIDAAQGLENDVEAANVKLTSPQTANRNDAVKLLTQARAQHAVRTDASLANARASALEAQNLLEQLLGELEESQRRRAAARLDRATAKATETAGLVEQLLADVEAEMAKASNRVPPEIPGQHEVARKDVASAKRRLASAQQKEDLSGIEAASARFTEVSAELQAMLAVFRPVTLEDRGVPAWLQSGASLFFQGEYDKSLAALDPALGTAPGSSQLHVHLIRAAALHALFVRSGQTNEAHRTRALTEIEQCRLIDPDFQPDTRAFSPRFIAFYQNETAPEARP